MKYDAKLYLFDADGTLVEMGTQNLLPNVSTTLAELPEGSQIAIVTNQGGVGLRHWMEEYGFGNPKGYPTQDDAEALYSGLLWTLSPRVYMAFRYQSKASGEWSPVPDALEDDPRWSKEWRKPAPGMLIQAMIDAGVGPDDTIMVGDRDEDEKAAHAAGVHFVHADDFFNRRS